MDYLREDFFDDQTKTEATRAGFGRGLKQAGELNQAIVGLCADLTESTHMHLFAEQFPERFIQVGIAEQNLITVASGLARAGKVPFTSSYAAFSPGRSWEQIKTTVCLNDQPVKIIGGHTGIYTGPDGATHQMLEDIALMRVLPNMVVIVPGDSIEAEKATLAIAKNNQPSYLRLSRQATPIFSKQDAPFEIGRAYILHPGHDVSLIGTGTMTHKLLLAARRLEQIGIHAEVVHCPTIKPLDEATILGSAERNGRVVTCEEAQIAGGLGGAVAELLAEKKPTPLKRLGINDHFGESGDPDEIFAMLQLDVEGIVQSIKTFVETSDKYHQSF